MKNPWLKWMLVGLCGVLAVGGVVITLCKPESPPPYQERVYTSTEGARMPYRLYVPPNYDPKQKYPLVIWLHGSSYSLGSSWVYHSDLHPILALAQAGYAVLAFDQTGFGSRNGEAAGFYNKYPHWSQLGHMIADTRAAID